MNMNAGALAGCMGKPPTQPRPLPAASAPALVAEMREAGPNAEASMDRAAQSLRYSTETSLILDEKAFLNG